MQSSPDVDFDDVQQMVERMIEHSAKLVGLPTLENKFRVDDDNDDRNGWVIFTHTHTYIYIFTHVHYIIYAHIFSE